MTIRLQTKEDFKEAKEKYKDTSKACWKIYMWDLFKSKTCYITEEDCFISFDKALELNYIKEYFLVL